MGNNICGLISKKESLLSNIEKFKFGVFCLQETKLSNKGLLKVPHYVIFEVIRKNRDGGSLMTGVHENLDPVLIFEDQDLEILVIQIKINNIHIRILNAYGPQEYANHENIINFYSTLDQIIQNAKFDECLILCQLDANAKVGHNIIKNDPHPQTSNGKYLVDLVDRNSLVLCNATDKCQGLITRRRITQNKIEESIIDYLIVCENMFSFLESMIIDQSNIHSRYIRRNNQVKVIPSDHIPIIGHFKLKWNPNMILNSKRRSIFNFKNKAGISKFKQLTSGNILSSVFQDGHILEE